MATATRKSVLLLLAAIIVLVLLFQRTSPVNRLPASPGARRHRPSAGGLLDDINNSTFGFQTIFVMGLPERTDRRDQMVLQAGLSEISIEFINGPRPDDINPKAVPANEAGERLQDGALGCWRGHMNALQEIVRRNLTSALILEDDSAWDVRIRDLLINTALATRALTQPLLAGGGSSTYADPSYPEPAGTNASDALELSMDNLPMTVPPRVSPYGDEWEMLWLGHCGVSWPVMASDNLPYGRVLHYNDTSVPHKGALYSLSNPFLFKDNYPVHTRAFHHVEDGVCSLGYAVTQKGARGLLRELALREATEPLDLLLRYYCKGMKGRRKHKCLTAQPPLFSHHKGVGLVSAGSNIAEHGEGYRKEGKTDMIRWSVALNADQIMDGSTNYTDGFPDPE